MPAVPIRVFLVEDSPIALTILKRILGSTPDLEVVGTAANGVEVLATIPPAKPDVICTDFHMPKMGGLELTRNLMEVYPRPILVVSASVQEEDQDNVFRVLEAGALDVFPKPRTGLSSEYEQNKAALIHKVKLLAGIRVFTQRRSRNDVPTPSPSPTSSPYTTSFSPPSSIPAAADTAAVQHHPARPQLSVKHLDIRAPRVLAIGASTGGPQALKILLSSLPRNFPIPVVCVQHISEGFLGGLVNWLNQSCALQVQEAQNGGRPQAGFIYFAPDQHHLIIDSHGCFQLLKQPPVSGHRPSVTTLFNSVAAYYRRSAIGVLLTGMGSDGATGLQAMALAGAHTIAQDEASCVVFGMPKEAISLGAAQQILPLDDIAPTLLKQILAPQGTAQGSPE